MVTLIVVLCLGLITTVMYCSYLTQQLYKERRRRYEAEMWIDPVSLEESK